MKPLLILITLSVSLSLKSQTGITKYDKALADSLGADEYGMKTYFLVILKTGPNTTESKESRDKIFRGHMDNMIRLEKINKPIVAGPFRQNDKSYRGLFILSCTSIGEANKILETDPAVKAKVLDTEIFEWYGSAALPLYLKDVEKIQKKSY
jgi:uncharacterized protein YciI